MLRYINTIVRQIFKAACKNKKNTLPNIFFYYYGFIFETVVEERHNV